MSKQKIFSKKIELEPQDYNNLVEYGLAPTAEECATIFGANRLLSYKNLPTTYYQIGEKFRIVIEYMPFRKQLESIPKIFFRKRKQFEAEHEGQLHALEIGRAHV